ncbi:20256_t:CDS:2 [Gigaspora rosea]|nr:20256_t:CDS:2 [Gigaspora rosea]
MSHSQNLPSKLYDEICAIAPNEYMENDNTGIEFSCLLELEVADDPHKLSKKIAELVGQGDGYNYIYKESYDLKKVSGGHSFWYYCSQCQALKKRPRKHEDLEKQRDRDKQFELELNYPDLTQKQVHAWWNKFIKEKYIHDNNLLNSMKILLEEYKYSIVLENITGDIKYLGFLTPFFNLLLKNKEIVVDATLIGQFDGAGFAMAYLFIDSNKKDNGARTDILKYFFQQLKTLGMDNITFFLTDKDFSQTSATQSTWPNAKVQICLWHLKKAIKKRLSDNTLPKTITYSSINAHNVIEQDKENQMNIINIENIEEIENYENSDEDLDDLYQNYELCLTKALKIVQEQKAKQNYRWAKSV